MKIIHEFIGSMVHLFWDVPWHMTDTAAALIIAAVFIFPALALLFFL